MGRSGVLTASRREFHDADGSARYGHELNLSERLALDARWAVEIKGAHFDGAMAAFPDRDKVWAALEYRY